MSEEKLKWIESHAEGEGKAVSHALVEWEKRDGCVVVKINGSRALRFQIKYREDGPYLSVEQNHFSHTGETYGACTNAGHIASKFNSILEAHNKLGDLLGASRSFILANDPPHTQSKPTGE